jgi:hypothetical protein
MFTVVVRTDIEIEAPPPAVWDVLTDLEAYEAWNPMIRSASGTVKPGERLCLRFNPPGTRARVFRPTVLVADRCREFRWLGRPRIPLVLDSEHYFILEELPEGRTLLRHDMIFFGLIVPLISRIIHEKTVVPFTLMNRALNERVEKT